VSLTLSMSDVFTAVGRPACCSFPLFAYGVYVMHVNISYTTLQAHGIVNVVLHREYSPGIVFIFSQGRKDLYHV
jgi:multidrug transporter EmrE-like cation transporter